GKELVARSLHEASGRHQSRMVTVNCAAIPPALFESELFGHKRGAFTGASEDHKGLFEIADGGTLFLDEIGEMSLELQVKLLRVLERSEFRPLGSNKTVRVDVRVVAATNKTLADEAAAGRFREDLYYRLNVIHVEVPPLRGRKEDIPALAEAFLKDMGRQASDLSPAALEVLLRHIWPGNIRELRHALERAGLLAGSGQIEPKHLGLE
ncbi:MAG: sigma 54-interacting transcriptional regulator, partial [Bacteroidota bacterium]